MSGNITSQNSFLKTNLDFPISSTKNNNQVIPADATKQSQDSMNDVIPIDKGDTPEISNDYKHHGSDPSSVSFMIANNTTEKVAFLPQTKHDLTESNTIKKHFILKKMKNNPEQLKKFNELLSNINPKNQEKIKEILDKTVSLINKDKLAEQKSNQTVFYGKNKGCVAILKNKDDEKKLSDDYVKVVKSFKGLKNIDISFNSSFFKKIEQGRDYFRVEGSNRVSYGITNELASNSKKEESLFRSTLLSSKRSNLTPVDFIKSALEITKGDYQKATLVVHNTLKSITYDLRDADKDKDKDPLNRFFTKNARNYKIIGTEKFTEDLKIVGKLANLRSDVKSNDKMGVWYHFFGVQLACSTQSSSFANAEITMEHIARKGYPLTSISPVDDEKSNIDNLSYDIFKKLSK